MDIIILDQDNSVLWTVRVSVMAWGLIN